MSYKDKLFFYIKTEVNSHEHFPYKVVFHVKVIKQRYSTSTYIFHICVVYSVQKHQEAHGAELFSFYSIFFYYVAVLPLCGVSYFGT